MTQTRNDFTKGAIPGLVTRMALPIIGAQIVNALYNIVDRMYIGRLPGVGSLALTGVGVTFPLILLISAFAQLSGMGGAPLCSIARGEGKDEYAERILGTSFSLLLLFGAVAMGAGYAFKAPLLYFFGASDNTFPYADSYMQVYLAGTVFVMLAMGLNPFVNSQGFTRYSMLVMMAGAVANIALDPLFMFVLGMGIRGAALATVLSQGLCAFLMLRFLTGPRCLIRLRVRNLRPRAEIVKRVLALGASSCTMNVTECIVAVVCNRTLRAYGGDVYVGVMTVISSVRQVLMMPVSGKAVRPRAAGRQIHHPCLYGLRLRRLRGDGFSAGVFPAAL